MPSAMTPPPPPLASARAIPYAMRHEVPRPSPILVQPGRQGMVAQMKYFACTTCAHRLICCIAILGCGANVFCDCARNKKGTECRSAAEKARESARERWMYALHRCGVHFVRGGHRARSGRRIHAFCCAGARHGMPLPSNAAPRMRLVRDPARIPLATLVPKYVFLPFAVCL